MRCFVGGRITNSSLSIFRAQEEKGNLEDERKDQRTKNLLLVGFYLRFLNLSNIQLVSDLHTLLCWLMLTYLYEKTR